MDIIDLKSREVFSHGGRGIAALVEEPYLTIRQVGLEPGKEIPVHTAETPLILQVSRGEGVFSSGKESVRVGPGKLLRIAEGAPMGIRNESSDSLVVLVIQAPAANGPAPKTALDDTPGAFVNIIDFAPLKPGKDESFREWFRRSSELLTKHPGFLSRTLLGPIEGGSRYAAVVEHESKETFMDMQLSDERQELLRQAESLVLGPSAPHFYETIISYRKPGRR